MTIDRMMKAIAFTTARAEISACVILYAKNAEAGGFPTNSLYVQDQ